jgi:hypothetical protein
MNTAGQMDIPNPVPNPVPNPNPNPNSGSGSYPSLRMGTEGVISSKNDGVRRFAENGLWQTLPGDINPPVSRYNTVADQLAGLFPTWAEKFALLSSGLQDGTC